MAGKGGKRPGAGRPKGSVGQAVLTKQAIRDHIQARVSAELDPLLDAQFAQARGLKYLVTRDKKTGKFIRVGEAMASNDGEETIEVWEKDPSTPAFIDLINRAADKAKEQPQDLNIKGAIDIISIIRRRRDRSKS